MALVVYGVAVEVGKDGLGDAVDRRLIVHQDGLVADVKPGVGRVERDAGGLGCRGLIAQR